MKELDYRSLRHPTQLGKTFSRLTVIEQSKSTKGKRMWLCQCECGNKHRATTYMLTSGQVKSCGCLKTDSKVVARRTWKNPYSLSPTGCVTSKTE